MQPDWVEANLVCPRDRLELRVTGDRLLCAGGHSYPYVDGIPVLLVEEAAPESGYWTDRDREDEPAPGVRDGAVVDPYVAGTIAGLCGSMFRHVVDDMRAYPKADLRLPPGGGRTFLEVGSNWGRWCLSAARKGYRPVGIDPSFSAIRAARRVAHAHGLSIDYLVAEGRFLPFRDDAFDVVFSYNVLQHLEREDVRACLLEIARVVQPAGRTLVQMANAFGARNFYNRARLRFASPGPLDVHYWTPNELLREFTATIGDSRLSADGFFSLNARLSDASLLPRRYLPVLAASELLRRISDRLGVVSYVADSVFVHSDPAQGRSL